MTQVSQDSQDRIAGNLAVSSKTVLKETYHVLTDTKLLADTEEEEERDTCILQCLVYLVKSHPIVTC